MNASCQVVPAAGHLILNRATLQGFVGKGIGEICGSGYHGAADNHCAHFVSHVLGYTFGLTCRAMTGKGDKGYSLRVQELFPKCGEVGAWADRKATSCLVFITVGAEVDLAAKRMNNIPRKHVGIFIDDTVWHYSNSKDRVVTQTPDQFALHYPGKGISMFYGTLPE